MKRKFAGALIIALFAICSTLGRAQGFTDTFSGTTINTANWVLTPGPGTITQNDGLILSNSIANGNWNNNYVNTVGSFPRASGSNVLQVTFDYAQDGIWLAGLYTAGTSVADTNVAYGWHNDSSSVYALDGWEFKNSITGGKTGTARITLDPTQGALWQNDKKDGNGFQTVLDTRGTDGDTSANYQFYIMYNSANNVVTDPGHLTINNFSIAYVTPPVKPTPTPTPTAVPIATLPFTENFSGGIDTTKWNIIGQTTGAAQGNAVGTFKDAGDGQTSLWLNRSHQAALTSVMGFQRGHNLRVTFEVWGRNGEVTGLYGPWKSVNTWDITGMSGYQGLFSVCGGVCGAVAPANPQIASFQENNVSSTFTGSQDGIPLCNAYNNTWVACTSAANGDTSLTQRMKIQIWLGDTAGATGYFGTAASSTLTQFSVNEGALPSGMTAPDFIDTRSLAAGTNNSSAALWGRNSSEACNDIVNDTTPVYLGFCMGDSNSDLFITNIVVENDLNPAPTPTPTTPVALSSFNLE